MNKLNPTIQWVGGKSRLIHKLIENQPKEYNTYHEIFLGGASLLFTLQPKKSYCYELNKYLCILYNTIQTNHIQLIEELSKIEKEYINISDKNDRKQYYLDKRTLFNSIKDNTDEKLEVSVLFKFINKTCFNALYRENKKGEFNVPFGNGRDPTICDKGNIEQLHKYLNENDIQINNSDFELSLQNIKKGDFVYIDPPYYPLKENSFTTYTKGGFNQEDHDRLISLCKKINEIGAYFILSNSNCDYIKNSFSEDTYKIFELSIARTLNSNKNERSKKKCEIIVKNY